MSLWAGHVLFFWWIQTELFLCLCECFSKLGADQSDKEVHGYISQCLQWRILGKELLEEEITNELALKLAVVGSVTTAKPQLLLQKHSTGAGVPSHEIEVVFGLHKLPPSFPCKFDIMSEVRTIRELLEMLHLSIQSFWDEQNCLLSELYIFLYRCCEHACCAAFYSMPSKTFPHTRVGWKLELLPESSGWWLASQSHWLMSSQVGRPFHRLHANLPAFK